jgi:hypothetical protein
MMLARRDVPLNDTFDICATELDVPDDGIVLGDSDSARIEEPPPPIPPDVATATDTWLDDEVLPDTSSYDDEYPDEAAAIGDIDDVNDDDDDDTADMDGEDEATALAAPAENNRAGTALGGIEDATDESFDR